MTGEARDRAHLEQIVELADLIARRLEGLTSERFGADRDEVDLTAYRLSAIGEATRKLSNQLKSRHPSIPWPAIYAMRNIIAHDYGKLIPIRVWEAAIGDLDDLVAACRAELDRSG